MITALVTFIMTSLPTGLRQVPRVHIGRPAGALAGAVLMIVTGVITLDEAVAAVLKTKNGEETGASAGQAMRITVTAAPRWNAAGSRTFSVALLCETDEERAKGLQGFRPLKQNEAALFVFEKPEAVTFWMGTVAFPIDIIFVSPGGYVVKVAPHCLPGSGEFYGSGVLVKWVFETAAGSGIVPGDRVIIQ